MYIKYQYNYMRMHWVFTESEASYYLHRCQFQNNIRHRTTETKYILRNLGTESMVSVIRKYYIMCVFDNQYAEIVSKLTPVYTYWRIPGETAPIITCIFVAVTAWLVIGRCIRWTTRHTLIIQSVQMQRKGAGDTWVLAGAAARATRLMACFA